MPTLLELVAQRSKARIRLATRLADADDEFGRAVTRAKEVHSWAEIAAAAGMTRSGCQHVVRAIQKGEKR